MACRQHGVFTVPRSTALAHIQWSFCLDRKEADELDRLPVGSYHLRLRRGV